MPSTQKKHYAMGSDVVLAGNRVAEDSKIWMDSLYNLDGKLFLTRSGRISFAERFDFPTVPGVCG